MSYEVFKEKVFRLVKKAGGDISVKFLSDTEHGKYYANCSDGVRIIGHKSGLKVSVIWGDKHVAMAEI